MDVIPEDAAYSSLSPLRFLYRSAEVWADRPAVISASATLTYAEHYERVRRTCGLLRTLGVRSGDRVATLLPNAVEMLELHYAVPGVGGVLVPMNVRLAAAEYAYILSHSGAKVVIAHERWREVLESALASLGTGSPLTVWTDGTIDPTQWDNALLATSGRDLKLPADERTLLSINYTSGTTGRPKGVMTTHRGAYLHSLGVLAHANLSPRSIYLWTLPMFHCNGWAFTWAATAAGSMQYCIEDIDANVIWTALLDKGVTHLCAAPTVVIMLLGASEAKPCPLPVQLFIGGAPPSPTLLRRAADLNIEIVHLYGLTETYGPIAVCAWNPDWDILSSEGKARLRSRQGVSTVVSEPLRVVDHDMRDVPRDGITLGEVIMRGNNVMSGYYRDPEGSADALRGGWFHSGDLAVMHPNGYIEIMDRLKDIIISGGENVASVEVEQALAAHPSVAEAAVVGVPDRKWGEVPVAFVTLHPDRSVEEQELRDFVGQNLARFKVPQQIHVVKDLPKTGTGKIQKFLLREQAVTPAS